jgi:hypothetical protein
VIRTVSSVLIALAVWSVAPLGLRAQTAVACRPHISAEEHSGWCDFDTPVAFKKGERLRLAVGGTARKIILRLLPKGADPNTTTGVIPTPFTIPSDRFLVVTVPYDVSATVQISVHGGQNPWGQYSLGAGNGPATISGVERLPTPTTKYK